MWNHLQSTYIFKLYNPKNQNQEQNEEVFSAAWK